MNSILARSKAIKSNVQLKLSSMIDFMQINLSLKIWNIYENH